jgi:hypothetical protein
MIINQSINQSINHANMNNQDIEKPNTMQACCYTVNPTVPIGSVGGSAGLNAIAVSKSPIAMWFALPSAP